MATDAKTGQPIYHGAPSVGLRNVGSYQVSGEPWISGSEAQAANKVKRFQFPYVTREVTVQNYGDNELRVHFVSGSGHTSFSSTVDKMARVVESNVYLGLHYITLSGAVNPRITEGDPSRAATIGSVTGSVPSVHRSVTFKAKCKEIYIATTSVGATSYRIMADLTNIPTRRMYHLTGSGHTEASATPANSAS
jgi:hypothetical protein